MDNQGQTAVQLKVPDQISAPIIGKVKLGENLALIHVVWAHLDILFRFDYILLWSMALLFAWAN